MGMTIPRIGWKWLVGVVLLAGAVEAVNFFALGPALDPGPVDPRWYVRIFLLQATLLHTVGFFAIDWVDGLGIHGQDGPVLVLCGYVTTALVLFALAFVLQSVLRRRRQVEKPPVVMKRRGVRRTFPSRPGPR